MKMREILSGFITAVGWENGVLEIWMKNGVGYRYHGVTEAQYHSIFTNSDFGKNYNALKPNLPTPEKFVIYL